MKQSHSYRRKNVVKAKHSKWELTYGVIATKLLAKGNLNTQNAFAVAKFLGIFVYLYSFPYGWIKMLRVKYRIQENR